MIFRRIRIINYDVKKIYDNIGMSKFSDIAFPRTSSWMAYVQGFKLNLLWTSCVKYLQITYTIRTMYIRIYTKIYCIQTSCDSLRANKREIEARAEAMKNKLSKV